MLDQLNKAIEDFREDNGINANAVIMNIKTLRQLKNKLGVASFAPLTYKGCQVYLNQTQLEADIRVGYVEDIVTTVDIEPTKHRQPKLPYFEEEQEWQ